MKVLITGGAGFIGYHTAKKLLEEGHQVRLIDNLSTGKLSNVTDLIAETGQQVDFEQCDVAAADGLSSAVRYVDGVDSVIHLAAQVSVQESIKNPQLSTRTNLMGFLNVLDAVRLKKIPRFVYASSAAVYGSSGGGLPLNEFSYFTAPMSPYGADKLANDMYAQLYHNLYGLTTIGLRYFNVYGPRQDPRSEYAGVVSKFIDLGLNYQPLLIYGDGEQTRNFVHVSDVAAVNAAAAVGAFGFRYYQGLVNVGCPYLSGHPRADTIQEVQYRGPQRSITINELVRVINRVLPEPVTVERRHAIPGDVRSSIPDLTRLLDLLPSHSFTDLEAGLRDLVRSKLPPSVR